MSRKSSLRRSTFVVITLIALLGAASAQAGESLDAKAAFERLSGLEGTWSGGADASGVEKGTEDEDLAGQTQVHEIVVSANGSVVMETMGPGTDHEMINMYHLDGDDLVLTHYCASGNQPTMKLDREKSTADRLVFEFTGGTNLDPKVDGHIHEAELILDGEKLESRWVGYNAGAPAGTMVFHLERASE